MSLLREFKKFSDNFAAVFDLSSLSNPSNPTLALNLLTKNNEKTIKAALESCHDVVEDLS